MNRAQNINNDEEASALKEDLNKCLSGFGIDMNEFNKQVKIAENVLQAENVKDTIQDVKNKLAEVEKVTDVINNSL